MVQFTSYTSPPSTGATKENLDPKLNLLAQMECPVYDAIGRGTTKSRTPQLIQEGLGAAGSNSNVEGSAFTSPVAAALIDGNSRRSFETQIFDKEMEVTGTEMATDSVTYQGKARMAEQLALQGMELKRDIEWAIIGSEADGNYDGTPVNVPDASNARFITNAWNQIAAAATVTPADADDDWSSATVAAVEADINELATELYKSGGLTYKMGNSFVKDANMMVLSPTNKARLDALLDGKGNSYRTINDMMGIQGQKYTKYVTSFGPMALVPDLHCVNTDVLMFNPQNWKWVSLRPTHIQDIAKVGDAERKRIVHEGTLIHRHNLASGKLTGLVVA